MSIGSVQLIAVAFPASGDREARILRLLRRLDDLSAIRILDLLVVHKELSTGDLVALAAPEERDGAVIGVLLGFEFDDADAPTATALREGSTYGLGREDVEDLGESIEPGMSAALVLVEHRWAAELERAIREAGAVPLGDGLLTLETVADVADELDAARDAHDEGPGRASTRRETSG
jgi:hypothetical protein